MLMANATAGNVSLRLGAQAGAHAPVSACASSNEAIAYGIDMIRLGRADVVVVGGTEGVIHPLPISCFAAMQAMSRRNDDPERASRPWDKGRDGFVLGEGAAVLVIESLEYAQARGARIYGELAVIKQPTLITAMLLQALSGRVLSTNATFPMLTARACRQTQRC